MSKAKSELHDVKLVYRGSFGRGVNGAAKGKCRLTPKQIVVESGTVASGPYRLVQFPYRFHKNGGAAIGSVTGWRLAPGERERLCGGTEA